MPSRPANMRTMDINEILEVLPHRHPFLLVDRVLDLEPGVRAVGLKAITINEPYFQGHFPGHPVMPAVLITEAMAQVAGILLLSVARNQGKITYFTGIDRQKFRKPVVPGDLLVFRAELIGAKGLMGKVRVAAYVFRLEYCSMETPLAEPSLTSLPRNGIVSVLAPGSLEGRPGRTVLLGSMEGELAAEGELMFALVDPSKPADEAGE